MIRDFTYRTRQGTLKFAHPSAVDYLQTHRSDHQDYSDAVCHGEMALTCINYNFSRASPSYLPDIKWSWQHFTSYAAYYWVKHCARLDREQRERLGLSDILIKRFVKGAPDTAISGSARRILQSRAAVTPNVEIAMTLACMYNLVEIGEGLIQNRLSAGEPLHDLLACKFRIAHEDDLNSQFRFLGGARTRERLSIATSPMECAMSCGSDDMIELLLKYDETQKPSTPPTTLTLENEINVTEGSSLRSILRRQSL